MAHHGDEMGEIAKRLARDLQLGATRQFPQGRLNETDEGELKLAVGIENGKVVINFGKPVAWIGFDPQQARELAASLLEKAVLAQKEKERGT